MYTDPTGHFDKNAIGTGLENILVGKSKDGIGSLLIGAGGGTEAISGGTTSAISVSAVVVGAAIKADGFTQTTIGIGQVLQGLVSDHVNIDENMPSSLSDIAARAVDETIEAVTGKETSSTQEMNQAFNDFITSIATSVVDFLLIGTPTGDDTLEHSMQDNDIFQESSLLNDSNEDEQKQDLK